MLSDYIFFTSIVVIFTISVLTIVNDKTTLYDSLYNLKTKTNALHLYFNNLDENITHTTNCKNLYEYQGLGFCTTFKYYGRPMKSKCVAAMFYNDTNIKSFIEKRMNCSVVILNNINQTNPDLYYKLFFFKLLNRQEWGNFHYMNTHFIYDNTDQIIINIPTIVTKKKLEILYELNKNLLPIHVRSNKKSFNITFV